MRVVAALLTLVALGAAGFAGHSLWQEISGPPETPVSAQVVASVASAVAEPQPPAPLQEWPALFGAPQPPAPPVPQPPTPVVEPEPPKAPMPPLDSMGYQLKGVMRAENTVWAMISHPTGERVLRPGDELEPGLTVVNIDARGIQVTNAQGSKAVLAFDN